VAGSVEVPVDGRAAIDAGDRRAWHQDLADRFIAATAVRRHATRTAADRRLLRRQGGLKPQSAAG